MPKDGDKPSKRIGDAVKASAPGRRLNDEERRAKATAAIKARWDRVRAARAAAAGKRPADPAPAPSAAALARRNQYAAASFPHVIRKVAHRLARRLPLHIAIDDLVSSGVLGLIEAAERYDPSQHDRFEGFAEFRIRGAMLDDLRSRDPISRDMRRHLNELRDVNRRLESQLGRAPAPDEMAAALGIDIDEFYARQKKLSGLSTLSIDNAGPELLSLLVERRIEDPFDAVARRELVELLRAAIEDLPERQRVVISLHYIDGLLMREIGIVLGVTESRICQIHKAAVHSLREALGDLDDVA